MCFNAFNWFKTNISPYVNIKSDKYINDHQMTMSKILKIPRYTN